MRQISENAAFRVTVTIRNAAMLRAMERAGIYTARELAAKARVNPTAVYEYLALRTAPYASGAFRKSIMRISDVLRVPPEQLFPEPFLNKALKTNNVSRDLTLEEMPGLTSDSAGAALSYDPACSFLAEEGAAAIASAIDTLRPREARALKMYYGLDGERAHTPEELATEFGITYQRVRQIVLKAERKLRHPTRLKVLAPARDAFLRQ